MSIIEANKNKESPPFVFCISTDYWPHAAVAILSLLEKNQKIKIFIFYEKLSSRWKNKISKAVTKYQSEITFKEFDAEIVKNFKICGYLGKSAYFRLFVPEILDSYKRIIYLDSDLVALHDLSELMYLKLESNILAARISFHEIEQKQLASILGRSDKIPYFNSGVMVIDAEKWRQEQITRKTVEFIENNPNKLTYEYQCALNNIIGNNFCIMSPEWNVGQSYIDLNPSHKILHYNYFEIKSALKNPMIVHFNGKIKPWNLVSPHPYKKIYINTKRKLCCYGFIPDDFFKALPQFLGNKISKIYFRIKNAFYIRINKLLKFLSKS